nr:MAG: RNA-dependent RNA polymerase [Hangzhou mito-like virus 8]
MRDYLKACGEVVKAYLYDLPDPKVRVRTRRCGLPAIYQWLRSGDTEVPYERLIKLHQVVQRGVERGRMTVREAAEVRRMVRGNVKKLTDAITLPSGATVEGQRRVSHLIRVGVASLCLENWKEPLPEKFGSVFQPRHMNRTTKLVGDDTCARDVQEALAFVAANPALRVPGWEQIFFPLSPDYVQMRVESMLGCGRRIMGSYGCSVEPGLKVRGFFSPNSAVKALEYPLYLFLRNLEARTGLSSRYARDLSVVQMWMQQGRIVTSLDQSAATDRFPLGPQLQLMRLLGVPIEWIRLVQTVSRGKWMASAPARRLGFPEIIRARVGQAMGTRVSMPLYTLTQICIIAGLCKEMGFDPSDTFRVLGDDVVVANQAVASVLADLYEALGVTINREKSYESDRYAEFAGALITPENVVFNGKYKELSTDRRISYSLMTGSPVVPIDHGDYYPIVCAMLLEGVLPNGVPADILAHAKLACKSYLDTSPDVYLQGEALPKRSRRSAVLSVAKRYFWSFDRANSFALHAFIDKDDIPDPLSGFITQMKEWLTPLAKDRKPINDETMAWTLGSNLAYVMLNTVEAYEGHGAYSRYVKDDLMGLRALIASLDIIMLGNVAAYSDRFPRTWYSFRDTIRRVDNIARSFLWDPPKDDRTKNIGLLRLVRKFERPSHKVCFSLET